MSGRAIINAGGRRFETLLSTLHRYPEAPFAKLFPPPPRPRSIARSRREYFLDVTPAVFESVLGFLRTSQLSLPTDNAQVRAEIVHHMTQWGLLEHAFPSLSTNVVGNAESPVEDVVALPDICVVQLCDHMQHDQGVKRHALTMTYGADGFQLRQLTQRIRRDLEGQLSSTYWQCYQTNERAAFFVTTKVANGTADLLTTSVTQQVIEHTENMGYTLVSSYVTLSPDVVHTSVRMLIHNFTFRRSRQTVLDMGDTLAIFDGEEGEIETYENVTERHVGPRRQPTAEERETVPPADKRARDIWAAR